VRRTVEVEAASSVTTVRPHEDNTEVLDEEALWWVGVVVGRSGNSSSMENMAENCLDDDDDDPTS
jgi:hypothetical protein